MKGTRSRAAQAVQDNLIAKARRADAEVTESRVRETLAFLGFEEIAPGHFVRLDGPYGRTTGTEEARIFTTVRLDQVVGSVQALSRIVRRFSRVHGPLQR